MRVLRPKIRTQENPRAVEVGSRRWKGVTSACRYTNIKCRWSQRRAAGKDWQRRRFWFSRSRLTPFRPGTAFFGLPGRGKRPRALIIKNFFLLWSDLGPSWILNPESSPSLITDRNLILIWPLDGQEIMLMCISIKILDFWMEVEMGKNTKKSSDKLTSQAAKALQDENTSAIGKKLAASVLSQAAKGKETGKEMEAVASKVLKSDHYSDQNKSFAGSIVSQSNKDK